MRSYCLQWPPQENVALATLLLERRTEYFVSGGDSPTTLKSDRPALCFSQKTNFYEPPGGGFPPFPLLRPSETLVFSHFHCRPLKNAVFLTSETPNTR